MQPKHALAMVLTLALVSIGATAYSLVSYEEARAEWSALSASLGESDYDAAASDAAYARSEVWLPRIRYAASATAFALIVLALVAGALAPRASPTPITDGRLLAATFVDLAMLLVALAPALITVRTDPGLTLVIARIAPAVAAAWITAAAASGRTIGARALRISLGTTPGRDVGARVLLAQPALFFAPLLALASAARRARGEPPPKRWLAPHLALAGVLS